MSYLYRTGNGRNNIAFTTTANSSTKYLRRLGSGRTNINWYTIPQGSTYNILQRNGTGRNNILWSNLKIAGPNDPITQSNISGNFTLSSSANPHITIKEGTSNNGIWGFTKNTTVSTTLSNMTYSAPSSTVYPNDHYVQLPYMTVIPNNFASLWNRLYMYENDSNYVIMLVSDITSKENNTHGTQITANNYEYGAYKYNGASSSSSDRTMMMKLWSTNKTMLKIIFYHWA